MSRIDHAAATRLAYALALATLIAAALAFAGGGDPASGAPGDSGSGNGKPAGKKASPNIVVVLTDDQDVESMRVMPKVRKLITKEGTSFSNFFATNPVCCPSRSTMLTGRYSHSTGVFRNAPPNGGYAVFDDDESLPVWLQRDGYATGHIGKYVNGYGAKDPTEIPPGWTEWYGSVDPGTYRMYGYTLNENGNLVTYGDYDTPDPANYQTDVFSDHAIDFIKRRAPESQPFYLSIATLAPHVEVFRRDDGDDDAETPQYPNPRPAPRHLRRFQGENLPKTPSFNEADVSDKPEGIRNRPLMSGAASGQSRNRYRSRLGSLLAVDEMVKRIVGTLRKTGELNNTVIVFMSDNGFLLGEHRIPTGKQFPYEESITVPFEIRGPGIPKNEVRRQPAGNIDLAPTLLDLAGAQASGPAIDGRSIMPMIKDEQFYPGRAMGLENWCQIEEKVCFDPYNPEVPRYRGVRTDRYAYMRYPNGEQELYDLERDPFQLNSLQNRASYDPERAALGRLLDKIQLCAGSECRTAPKLKLKLGFRQVKKNGSRCVRSAVTASVAGGNAGDVVDAKFLVPGKDFEDSRRPIRMRIPPKDLNRKGSTPIDVQASVLDGRIMTVSGSIPRAC